MIEMTREQRFKRQAVFTAAMFLCCAFAFALRDRVVDDIVLVTNGVVWAIYNQLTRHAITAGRLDDREVRIRPH